MHLQFVHPWMLYLLWLAVAVGLAWLVAYRRQEQKLDKLLSAAMRQKLCPPSHPTRFYWQWTMLLTGLLLIVVAAARPQWGTREEKIFQRGRDLVIALDVSRSMLAQDVRPSRLERAKADIMDLLMELRGDRAALIVFRSKAVQICPLTTDHAFLEQALDDVTVESAPRGKTNIGDAIIKAMEAFESDEGAHKAIILISDGEDLSGQVKVAAEQAQKKGIAVFTVGLGDPNGSTIPDEKRKGTTMTYQGKEVVTKLKHDTMKEIAEITGGAYVPVAIANVKLGTLYRDHLSKIAAQDIEESIQERYIDRYQFFLLPALLLFLATACLSRGRLATGRPAAGATTRSATAVSLTFLILAFGAAVCARAAETNALPPTAVKQAAGTNAVQAAPAPARPIPPGQAGARIAQRLYLQGKYRESAEAYLQSGKNASRELQNNMIFNAGCALYKAGEYEAAAKKFSELAQRENADVAGANYNLGCSMYQLAGSASGSASNQYSATRPVLLEQSGLAFQSALRLDPDNSSTRDNLSVVANILPGIKEQVKIQELMARYGQSQPFQLAEEMLKNQRGINEQTAQVMTNTTPARINLLEKLGARQKANADLLIPLKPILAAAMSSGAAVSSPQQAQQPQQQQQAQQLAELDQHVEAVRNVMHQAAEQLRDLDDNAGSSTGSAESGIYRIWKGTAPYAPLLQEDIRRQTNVISMTTNIMEQAADDFRKAIQAEQDESLELTRLFVNRFSEAVPPEGLGGAPSPGSAAPGPIPAPPSGAVTNLTATATNQLQLSAETRTNILNLAGQATAAQTQASKLLADAKLAQSLAEQQKSHDLLKKIQELLPKNQDKQQKQDQQQQPDQQQQQDQHQDQQQPDQQQQQDQQQQGEQQQDQQQQGEQQQDQQQQDQEQPQDQPKEQENQQAPQPEPQQEPEKQAAQQEQKEAGEKEMTPEQAKALLEKARQREKDHQEEKTMRSYIPPSQVDMDW